MKNDMTRHREKKSPIWCKQELTEQSRMFMVERFGMNVWIIYCFANSPHCEVRT